MCKRIIIAIALLFLVAVLPSYAFMIGVQGHYGTGNWYLHSAPRGTTGGGGEIQFIPKSTQWGPLELFFEVNETYWRTQASDTQNRIWITAIAPVLRLYLYRDRWVSPFLQGSVGPSIMSATHFGGRTLGINFAFQDIGAFGLTFGRQRRLAILLRVLHYSNASIAKHNSGITVPADIAISYRF